MLKTTTPFVSPWLAKAVAFLFLSGCSSFHQSKDEVWIRHGTNGLLEYWKPISEASTQHWPYAWASMAAYQYEKELKLVGNTTKKEKVYGDGCTESPTEFLGNHGWTAWPEIPALGDQSALGKLMTKAHLRAQVWENPSRKQIIVAFGGTNGIVDLEADMRWVEMPFGIPQDQYTVLFEEFVPAFRQIFEAKKQAQDGAWMSSASIVATGHSLGGGLAQGFAYAISYAGVKVTDVVTFDPSPVSGKRQVSNWQDVAPGIKIQRIYHRGELLAILRAGFNSVLPPKASNAVFTDIRYASEWGMSTPLTVVGAVRSHFLRHLACTMAKSADLNMYISPGQGVY